MIVRLHLGEGLVAHLLQFCQHVFAFILSQVEVPLNLIDLLVDVVVELLVEFELNLLLDILLKVRWRRIRSVRCSRHRVVLSSGKRVLHEQIWRQSIAALWLRHHVTSDIVPVLELEV